MARVASMIWGPLIVAAVLLGTTACSASLNNIHVGDRTLLIYPATGSTADAALTGVLHANSAGCLAIGNTVIVAPSGSSLMSDGSIVVSGTTYKLGSHVVIGGGGGGEPRGARVCGKHLQYFYV